ncbi:TetR/AcrR family transcriptional regulator [Demequina sp. NBRC 110057]|uniref:TetR/AcrR family transcriptional regulator n=1 Tax=Demequina sp. NBRC 110057 TaxID=1570346 RepID=UPI000A0244B8|nr:TetR/AcrR family transcriptional regulator [Demequina sp. NBRC 110057]
MPRQPRRDAVANRERLIDAAFELLAERDADLTVRELALATGHGIGTAYRHFPTHDDLIKALYDRAITRLGESITGVSTTGTAWDRVAGLLESITFTFADFPALRTVMRRMYDVDPHYRPGGTFTAALEHLIDAAVTEGSMRPGITGGDLTLTAFALAGVVGRPTGVERDMLRRQLAFVLEGMRAGHDAVPVPQAAMDEVEFHVFVHRANAPARAGVDAQSG